MKVAIVHYHLRPGGVTRVIECASRGLADAGVRHVILSGTAAADTDFPAATVSELDYVPALPDVSPEALEAKLRAAAEAALGGPPSIWHFHNPALGKVPAITSLVRRLADAGERLVLQVHDVAEDGRPGNYARLADRDHIHPIGPNIRYAFINGRDRDRFVIAGLPPQNSRLLPNPVAVPSLPSLPARAVGEPLVFYPARGIRRKNLGEILFLAALAPPGTRFAIASAPANPAERKLHDAWQAFANRHPLPVKFAVVGRLAPVPDAEVTFESWLAACTHLVTTSVAEGFGYAFADSLALRKPLIGREIPHLTKNPARGIPRFTGLYQHLIVPRIWVNEAELLSDLEARLHATYRSYGRPIPMDAVEAAWQSLRLPHGFDFGNLPEDIQRSCISRCIAEPCAPLIQAAAVLMPARKWLADRLETAAASPPTTGSPDPTYGRRLLDIYQPWAPTPEAIGWIDSARLLNLYLDPSSFQFLTSA